MPCGQTVRVAESILLKQQMVRRNSRRFKTVNTAKLALAVMLLVAFLSSIAPLASVSAGSVCRLECCAGRAPHAAGSCMGGSCHAVLGSHQTAKFHRAKLNQSEQFCGLSRTVATKNVARMRARQVTPPAKPDHSTALAAAFVKPCGPDCGACAAGSTNLSRQKNSAATAGAGRPRSPAAIHLSNPGYHRAQILEALCRQSAPRGPPLSFS
jgi:hypothetical protein